MSLARSIGELRSFFEKESENPDQYYQRVGKCPPGFSFDGKGCVKGGAAPEKPDAVKKGEPAAGDPKTPVAGDPQKPAPVEPAPKPGDLIRAPTDKDGWTKGDHLERAAEFLKIGGGKVKQIVAQAKAWLQKRWEGELATTVDELDNLSVLAVAHTSKRNEVEDKAAAVLEESPEEYAKKLRDAVPPEMVKDTQDAIDSFADEEDEGEKKKKKEKVEEYAEQSAASLIFGLLAVAFAPITAMALVGNWMAKKVGINIFGKSDEAAGDVVKNLDELDNMIVQEVISLLHQGTSSKDMEAAVQQHIDEEGEMPKQEGYVVLGSVPLNVGGQLSEWMLHESKPVKKWSEIGDGVQKAMNHFVREHGRFLEINGPEGDFENNGEINAGFSWELKRQFRKKELGDKNATMSGEAGFKLREVGSSQVADADSRAWGSAPWGGADAQEQRKSFRGKTRGDVLMQVFQWLAKVVQSQSQEVENNLHDARDQPYR